MLKSHVQVQCACMYMLCLCMLLINSRGLSYRYPQPQSFVAACIYLHTPTHTHTHTHPHTHTHTHTHTATGQGRMDRAVCEFTEDKKLPYLKRLQQAGVVNIEMECTAMASICHKTGMKCLVVCVTLLDRLSGDQVDISPEVYGEYQLRLRRLVSKFIRSKLNCGSQEPKGADN